MKRATVKDGQLLHVETPLGIVNIRAGLHDSEGRRVDSVEIIPNAYVGEPTVTLDGFCNSRLIEETRPACEDAAGSIAARLEYLRGELRAERLSYGDLAELQDLAPHIAEGDVELLEAAGVPEHGDSDD